MEDLLSIEIILMLMDNVLSHVSLEDRFKDRIDELLLLNKECDVIRCPRLVGRVKDILTTMSSGSGNSRSPP